MTRGEISIDERYCLGCGYCVHFCARGCIVIPGDRFTTMGYLLPVFINLERCNACAVCAWMCPHQAIEVYKYVESGQNEPEDISSG